MKPATLHADDSASQPNFADFFLSPSPMVGYEMGLVEGQRYFVTPNVAEVLGYPAATFLATANFGLELIHPAHWEQVMAWWQSLQVGDVRSLKYRLRHGAGHDCWVQDTLRVVQRGNEAIALGTLIDISEQEQLRQQLSQQQTLTQNVLDAISQPIFVKDHQHRYTCVNRAFAAHLGLPITEILGRDDYALFPTTQAEALRQQDLSARQQTTGICFEATHAEQRVLPKPCTEPIITRKTSFINDDQQYLCGIQQGATCDCPVKSRIAHSQQRFEKIADTVPGMIYQFCRDIQGNYTLSFVSHYCEEIFEVSVEVAIADVSLLFAMTHPADFDGLIQAIEISAQSLTPWQYEWRMITPSGKLKWIQGISKPERLPNGNIVWDGMMLDISDRKATELSLKQFQHRFQKLADSIPGMIYQFVRHPDGTTSLPYVNNGSETIYSVPPVEAIADVSRLFTPIHPDDLSKVYQMIDQSYRDLTTWRCEWRITTPSGETKWVQGISKPEKLADGSVLWDGIIIDISDRKRAEQELFYSRELKSTVVEIFQHLLRENDPKFRAVLEKIGQVTQSDRAFLLCYSQPERGSRLAQEWLKDPSLDSLGTTLNELEQDPQGWWMQQLQQEQFLLCHDLDQLPPAADSLKQRLQLTQIHSFIAVPITDQQQQLWGVIGLSLAQPGDRHFIQEDAQTLQMIGELLYVTATRQREQQQLQESEAKFRGIFDHAGVGIVKLDAQFCFLEVNHTFARLLGKTETALIGQSFLSLTATTNTMGKLRRNLQHRGDANGEVCLYDSVGREIYVKINISQVIPEEQETVYYIAVIEDISEQKRAEAINRSLLTRNQSLVIALGEVTYDHFLPEDILNWEGDFLRILGYDAAEMGQDTASWIGRIHPEDQQHVVTAFHKAQHNLEIFDIEYRFLCKNGVYRWMHDRGVILADALGNAERLIGVMRDISARKAAEQQLYDSEQRYRQIVETAQEGIWVLDTDANTTYVNPQMAEMLGYTPEEMQGCSFSHFISPEHKALAQQLFSERQTGQSSKYDFCFLHCDGSEVWTIITASPLLNDQGEFIGALGMVTDISDRKRAELQLEEISQRLTLATNAANVGIWDFDLVKNRVLWDTKMCQLYGLSPEEHNQSYEIWQKLTHPEDLPGVEAQFWAAIAGEGEYHTIFRVNCRTGEMRYLEGHALVLRDEAGQAYRVIGVNWDVSDRQRYEIELRRNRDLREAIFRESADALFLVDNDTLLTFDCNQKAVEMFEAAAKWELIGIEGHTLQREQFTEEEIATINQEMVQQGEWSREIEYVTKKGRIFWGRITAKLINVAGRVMNLVQVADIDQRKQAEQQLRQTNAELQRATRLKDEFLANMSHELRTPLNAILGLSEVLQDGIYGELTPQQRRSLQTIERNGQHLLELINDILNLAKIEAGHFTLNPTAIAINEVCDTSLNLIRQQAQQKQQQIRLRVPKSSPIVQGDALRLRQAIINLLSNAIKFTDEGGEITLAVSLHPQQQQLAIHVVDNGIGIAAADLNKLFQPFVQLDSSLARRFSGTGLGLALVRRIAELHGGTVAVTSQLGKGSQFSILLPWQPTDAEEPVCLAPTSSIYLHSDRPLIEAKSTHQPIVLIADDDDDNIETLWDYLRSRGYRLLRATNGREVIDLTRSQRPHLILMDIQMPEMDGLTAIARLRETFTPQELPIIALTALAMNGDRQRCLDAGANLYITKPCRLKTLERQMQNLLTQH